MPPPIEPDSFGRMFMLMLVSTWLALVSPITDFRICAENLVFGILFIGSCTSFSSTFLEKVSILFAILI